MYSTDTDDWLGDGADDNDEHAAVGRGSALIQRRVPLRELTQQFDNGRHAFWKPGGTLLFPDAPAGVYLCWSNRDPADPDVLAVQFAFAQQRATPGLHDAVPIDADPVAGLTPDELRAAGWARAEPYGPGRFSRGGHAHRSVQTAITPTMTNRPESTWLAPGNPPEGHLLRLSHDGWNEPVDIGGRWYGTRALSWWPDIYWRATGERVPQGSHQLNHYYRGPDDWVGPMTVYPEGLSMQLMATEASLDSMLGGGWYSSQDRWRFHFSDHKVSGTKCYEITQSLNFPELLSLDRDPTDPDATARLCRRSDGYRVRRSDGTPWEGKCWSDSNEVAGPDPALERDAERWTVIPALRVFLELAVPDGGWIPTAASQGVPTGWQTSAYYGQHFDFSTKGLTGWPTDPSHQHGEYLAAFALGRHFGHMPGLPDWFAAMDAISRWSANEQFMGDALWWRGCEAVHLEFDAGVLAAVPHTPWPAPVESWDGVALAPTTRARVRVSATNSEGTTTAQVMLDSHA